jgi:hypothetical protein
LNRTVFAWAGSARAACAGCGSTDEIEPYDGEISEHDRERWVMATAADARAVKRNWMIAVPVVMLVFGIAVVFGWNRKPFWRG